MCGSSIAPFSRGRRHHLAELLLEAPVAGGRRLPALEAERRVGDLPAVVDAADDVVLGAAGVVEEHLAELGRAVGLGDAADLDAGLAHRHQQVRDALVLGRVGIGAGEQEAVVGVVATGGPHLLAVDDPLVAVEHRRRLQAGQVGAGVGLAEALAPAHLAAQDLGQELPLLLLGPPLQQRRPDERVAEEVGPHRRLGPGELLGDHDALHRRQPLAAVLLGPGGADPTAAVELRRPLLVERRPLLGRHLEALVEPAGGQVLLEPGRAPPCGTARPRRGSSGPWPYLDPPVKSSTTLPCRDFDHDPDRDEPARRPARPAVRPRRRAPPRDRLLRGRSGSRGSGPAGRLRHVGAPRLEPRRLVQRGPHPRHHAGHLRVPRRAGHRRAAVPRARHPRPVRAGVDERPRGARRQRRRRARRRRRPLHADARRLARHPARQRRAHQRRRPRRRHRRHALAQPAQRRRLQVQPAARRSGRHRRHRLDRRAGQRAPGRRPGRRSPGAVRHRPGRRRAATTSWAPTSTTCRTWWTSPPSETPACASAPIRSAGRASTTGRRSPSATASTSPSSTRSSTRRGAS